MSLRELCGLIGEQHDDLAGIAGAVRSPSSCVPLRSSVRTVRLYRRSAPSRKSPSGLYEAATLVEPQPSAWWTSVR